DLLFKALKQFMIDRSVGGQNDIEKTSNIDSVRIMAAVSGDSVDIFYVKFYSQRDSTFQKTVQDKKTGETVQRTEVLHLIREYAPIGRLCYDAQREMFTEGVYKGISVGDVLTQEFLSP